MLYFPKQNYKINISQFAQKHNISRPTASKIVKQLGVGKTRDEYEQDAKKRRQQVYELRNSGMKWAEVAEILKITVPNAQMLASRYKKQKTA